MRKNLFEEVVVAVIVAIVGTIVSAIINKLVLTNTNYWSVWVVTGIICAFLVLIIYYLNNHKNIRYNDKIALLTDDKNYVTADLNQDRQLIGRSAKCGVWQTFEIVDANRLYTQEKKRLVRYGDIVALKAINNGCYVGANRNSEKQLNCWATRIQGWEKFRLEPPDNASGGVEESVKYGSSFALYAFATEQYVSYIHDEVGRLLAVAPKIKSWEKFTFVNPNRLSNILENTFHRPFK